MGHRGLAATFWKNLQCHVVFRVLQTSPMTSPIHPSIGRRQFIGLGGTTVLSLLLGSRGQAAPASGEFLFLEAEGFDNRGGWELDQQSMDVMGSPYLLAHGLGVPVADAVAITLPSLLSTAPGVASAVTWKV